MVPIAKRFRPQISLCPTGHWRFARIANSLLDGAHASITPVTFECVRYVSTLTGKHPQTIYPSTFPARFRFFGFSIIPTSPAESGHTHLSCDPASEGARSMSASLSSSFQFILSVPSNQSLLHRSTRSMLVSTQGHVTTLTLRQLKQPRRAPYGRSGEDAARHRLSSLTSMRHFSCQLELLPQLLRANRRPPARQSRQPLPYRTKGSGTSRPAARRHRPQ